MELILGNFNGVEIKGKKPRRPKMRKVDGGRAPLILKLDDHAPSVEEQQQPQQKRANNNYSNSNNNNNKTTLYNSRKGSKETLCSTVSLAPIKLLSPSFEITNQKTHFLTNNNEINDVLQQLNTENNDRWSIEKYDGQHYRINIHSVHDITDFIQALSKMSLDSSMQAQFNDLNNLSQSPRSYFSENEHLNTSQHMVKWKPIDLPYIHFHSELYAKSVPSSAKDWPRFNSVLPILLDDCVYTFMTCMNHYFPVQPKNSLVSWYSALTDPSSDPLVLSIAAYWVRHVFIHHPMAQLKNIYDSTILDAVQTKLTIMARDALANCFDEPHINHIYALCLCNMTCTVTLEQKATNHMLAVRMAAALGIKPLRKENNNNNNINHNKYIKKNADENEILNRLWWYLFQIDHFLTESGTISCSMLDPPSDDYIALSKLKTPSICSLDEPGEIAGVHVWSNVLKIWMIRRRILNTISTIDPNNEKKLSDLYDQALKEIDQWANELPDMLKPEIALRPDNFTKYAEASLTISMEKCTDVALISLRLLPRDVQTLNQLQYRAVLKMIDSSIELITTRQSVLAFAPCQTWPGDLKRSVQMLISCLKYNDPTIVSRARLGLMRALRLLKCMAEIKWHDHICTSMLKKIERLLIATDNNAYNTTSIYLREKDLDYNDDYDDEEENNTDNEPSPPITSYFMDITPEFLLNEDNTNNIHISSDNTSTFSNQCIENNDILKLTEEASVSEIDTERKSQFIPITGYEKRSIKISNNLYEGVMMMDREMRPRSQYYNPNITASHSALDDLIVPENINP